MLNIVEMFIFRYFLLLEYVFTRHGTAIPIFANTKMWQYDVFSLKYFIKTIIASFRSEIKNMFSQLGFYFGHFERFVKTENERSCVIVFHILDSLAEET